MIPPALPAPVRGGQWWSAQDHKAAQKTAPAPKTDFRYRLQATVGAREVPPQREGPPGQRCTQHRPRGPSKLKHQGQPRPQQLRQDS